MADRSAHATCLRGIIVKNQAASADIAAAVKQRQATVKALVDQLETIKREIVAAQASCDSLGAESRRLAETNVILGAILARGYVAEPAK